MICVFFMVNNMSVMIIMHNLLLKMKWIDKLDASVALHKIRLSKRFFIELFSKFDFNLKRREKCAHQVLFFKFIVFFLHLYLYSAVFKNFVVVIITFFNSPLFYIACNFVNSVLTFKCKYY